MNYRQARKRALSEGAAEMRRLAASAEIDTTLGPDDRARMSKAFVDIAKSLESKHRGIRHPRAERYPVHPDQMTIEDVPA